MGRLGCDPGCSGSDAPPHDLPGDSLLHFLCVTFGGLEIPGSMLVE